jgi:phospholipase C
MKAEKLIADTYNALRANPALWAKTLLVVSYDEHGGFYDHVPPVATVAPDDHTTAYGFTQTGVRVPALLISPWCDAGVDNTQFDHTSVLRYLCDKWGMPPLGERARTANSIATALRTTPRTDDTPAFIRVPNADLIPDNPDAERDATNANANGLHHFAAWLLAQIDDADTDAITAVTAEARGWTAFQHRVARALIALATRLDHGYTQNRARRETQTATTLRRYRDAISNRP